MWDKKNNEWKKRKEVRSRVKIDDEDEVSSLGEERDQQAGCIASCWDRQGTGCQSRGKKLSQSDRNSWCSSGQGMSFSPNF
jgi:hypothetical protein